MVVPGTGTADQPDKGLACSAELRSHTNGKCVALGGELNPRTGGGSAAQETRHVSNIMSRKFIPNPDCLPRSAPEITDQTRAKILGLNLAKLAGIEPRKRAPGRK